MANTVTLRGEGGAIFEVDLPPVGTHRREQYDTLIAAGRIEVVAGRYPPEDDDTAAEQTAPSEPVTPERPKVRDDIEVWRTYRAAQGHQVDGLTKPELQQLPDTPKEG